MKLNIGCGPRYQEGYVNIDACNEFRTDVVLRLPNEKLVDRFGVCVADELIADDVLEHFFRWEGIEVLEDFRGVLKQGGILTIKTPCLAAIIKSGIPIQRKMELIRGYQGQPMVKPGGVLGHAWESHTELFAHKYTWDEVELKTVLVQMCFGFKSLSWNDSNSMTLCAIKA